MSTGQLLSILEERFRKNMKRHPDLGWASISQLLVPHPSRLQSVGEMEATGGQPDIITLDGQPVFVDCSPESPNGRRSLCYDQAALKLRKVAPPRGDAVSLAAQMGVEILTIDQYHRLQALDKFDQKTSSWLATPNNIRELGGAIFGDRRYDTVFTYHNGADSYYAARGFRCLVRI